MSHTNTLKQVQEWLATGKIGNVEFSAQAIQDRVKISLEDHTSDIDELEVRRVIAPYMDRDQLGRVMGALRPLMAFHESQQATGNHITPLISIEGMSKSLKDAKTPWVSHTFTRDGLENIINSLLRDRGMSYALRYAGLQVVVSSRGYAIKPMARTTPEAVS